RPDQQRPRLLANRRGLDGADAEAVPRAGAGRGRARLGERAGGRKGLALGYVIAPGVPDVVADEERVRQVLLNLLSNAVKYTDSGQVSLHIDAARERDEMVAVRVMVRDTGIGIPEALQAQLFQWFSH